MRERYYPVRTADGAAAAACRRCRDAARDVPHMTFIGRCGTYQYLDMDQVISQSLAWVRRWSRENRARV